MADRKTIQSVCNKGLCPVYSTKYKSKPFKNFTIIMYWVGFFFSITKPDERFGDFKYDKGTHFVGGNRNRNKPSIQPSVRKTSAKKTFLFNY